MFDQPGFSFPQQLSEKYQPRAIAQFVGLDKPKRICAKLAAHPYSSAWLFIGPSGTGKTTMALALAEEMQAELHLIPSKNCDLETIERTCRTCAYVPMAGKRMHIILVDEADQMTPAAQISLLSKLDATAFPPNTVFVFTCNDSSRLEPRFLSRTHTIEFSSYGIAKEATALLESIWQSEAPGASVAPNFARIVKEANNNVRESLMKLETELMAA